MPTYEYRCAKCGRHFDVYQSFSEDPLTKHEECGGKLNKVLSPAGIVLKGSGFYKTDSRKPGSHGDRPAKSEPKSDSGAAAKTDTKTDSKSDGKPAGSTAAAPAAKSTDSKPAAAAS